MIFDTLFISGIVTLVLLVWFNSDAFIEYAILLGGKKFFLIDTYFEKMERRAEITYLDHILEEKDCFFVRLITCPLCLSFWITLLVTLLVKDELLLLPICNVLSLVTYKLTSNLLES